MNNISCLLCKNTKIKDIATCHDTQLYIDKKEFSLVQCTNCGFIYIKPQPTPEELKPYYPSNYPSYLLQNDIFSISPTYNLLRSVKHLFTSRHLVTKIPSSTKNLIGGVKQY